MTGPIGELSSGMHGSESAGVVVFSDVGNINASAQCVYENYPGTRSLASLSQKLKHDASTSLFALDGINCFGYVLIY